MTTSGIVYLITYQINGKQYIGQTRKPLVTRWNSHVAAANANRRNTIMAKAIRKYGPEAFDILAIETDIDAADLDAAERFWIEWYGVEVPNGYNLTSGGRVAFSVSADTRRKQSIKAWLRSIRPNPERDARLRALGQNQSAETKEKIGAAHRGVPKSLEQRAKMSEAAKRRWAKASTEERVRMSDAMSKAQKRRWTRPEEREKMSEAQTRRHARERGES